MSTSPAAPESREGELPRGLGYWQAVSLNVANMVGIGPFITIPAFIAAMGGPQAVVAWLVAAVLVICDGLVWSELGAALPGSGGTYHFLREIFGRYRWGRLLPFLFIWQFLVSGALEMASGYIGGLQYLEYAVPQITDLVPQRVGGTRWVAALAVVVVTLVLCQNIRRLGWLSIALCAGTIITVLTVIVAGIANFNGSLLTLPTEGVPIDAQFANGLGAAMLIAIYDYLGYFNICHLGDEVIEPQKTIPRAILVSVILVAAICLTMNVAIIGVIPWQEAMVSKNVAALFMERLYGRPPYVPRLRELAAERDVIVECVNLPIRDACAPSPRSLLEILETIEMGLHEKTPTYLHCWGGHGRTGTVIACHLIQKGHTPQQAIEKLLRLRANLPKSHHPFEGDQEKFVHSWAVVRVKPGAIK